MKRLLTVAALVLLASCASSPRGTAYGEGLTLDAATPIAAILAQPASYVGQRVQVEGTVREVCRKKGCWMDIAADGEDAMIQVKVEDDVIVFPVTARGKRARVEGVVETMQLTAEEAEAAARHRAEEQGETFDPASVAGPVTTYRIQGTGAFIEE
jgi:hypothetical protein